MIQELLATIDKENFSGVITIREGKTLIFHQAFGYAERSNSLKNQVDTSFGIASGTKIFTALGILKLIESGLLSFDQPIFDIINKPYPQYDSHVTVLHLLSHTSGLPDYYDEDFISDFDNFKVSVPWFELETPSDYMDVMPDRPMKFAVGEKFHYNNSGYVFLAMILEKLTGNYHEHIKNSIITPLNLNGTGYFKLNQLPANCAQGYIELQNNTYKSNIYNLPIIGGGDGGIYTTSEDLLTLWDALMEGNIIPMNFVDLMLKSYNNEDAYGLGVWLTEKEKQFLPSIVGSDAGVSFVSAYRSDCNIVYNILSNTSEGAWPISKVIREYLQKK